MLKNNKKILYSEKNNKKIAFSMSEVIVATFISAIVLSFIFIFLSNISDWIANTKKEAKIISSFYDFTYKLNNYSNIYTSGSILINNSWTWSDVFLMKDIEWENGILFWAINIDDLKIDTDTTIYENRVVWYRKISSDELADIDSDINNVYDYIFHEDNIFHDLKVYDFILISYNSWTIFDLSMIVNLDFQNSLVWQSWADLPREDFKKFNIDF